MPEQLRKKLSHLDVDGDGMVHATELANAISLYERARGPNDGTRTGDGAMPLAIFPHMLREKLKAFDTSGDEYIDSNELGRAAEMYTAARDSTRRLSKIVVWLAIGVILLLLAISGITVAVVELSKETTASADGTMHVAGDSDTVIKVASVETVLDESGVMLDRETGTPVRVEQALTPQVLSSRLPTAAFKELRYIHASSAEGADAWFLVQAVSRVVRPTSLHGSVVEVLTAAGSIVLDDEVMMFEEPVGHFFERAGFDVHESRRHLEGIVELLGFFNLAEQATLEGLPLGEVAPKLTALPFRAVIEVYRPCSAAAYPSLVKAAAQWGTNDTNASEIPGGESRDDLCVAPPDTTGIPRDRPGVVERDGARYVREVEISTTYGNLTSIETHFDAVPNMVKRAVFNSETDSQHTWQEFGGRIYHCSTELDVSFRLPEIVTADDAREAAFGDAGDNTTFDSFEALLAMLEGAGADVSGLSAADFEREYDNATEYVFDVPAWDTLEGVPQGDAAASEPVVTYEYIGSDIIDGTAVRHFRLAATIPAADSAASEGYREVEGVEDDVAVSWEYYDRVLPDGSSRPVRYVYFDRVGGEQINDVVEFELLDPETVNVTQFLPPPGYSSTDNLLCPNVTAPHIPVMAGPLMPEFTLPPNMTVQAIVPSDSQTALAMDDLQDELSRRLLQEIDDAQIAELIQGIHGDLLADTTGETRRRLSAITRINFSFLFAPFCGPEIELGDGLREMFPSLAKYDRVGACVDAAEERARAKGRELLKFRLKFYIDVTGALNSISDYVPKFDGFQAEGEMALDPWRVGVVAAQVEGGWTGAHALFDGVAGNGFGNIYGKAEVGFSLLNPLPQLVKDLLPNYIKDKLEQKFAEISLKLDSATGWLDLEIKTCVITPLGPSCIAVINFKVVVGIGINVKAFVDTGALEARVSQLGAEVEYWSVGSCRVCVPVLRHCCSYFRCGCWGCTCPSASAGRWWWEDACTNVPCPKKHTINFDAMAPLGIPSTPFTIWDSPGNGGVADPTPAQEVAGASDGGAAPVLSATCQQVDILSAFDRPGLVTCPGEDWALTSMWKNGCNKLYCLEYLMCCKVPAPAAATAVAEAACLSSAVAQFGSKVQASRGGLVAGSWGHVPPGCTVQSGGDWAAHYNRGHGASGHYTTVVPTRAVSEADCLAAAVAQYGSKVQASRGGLVAGSWGHVPPGCTVQSGGDWAAHYNRGSGASGHYSPVTRSETSECYLADWRSTMGRAAAGQALCADGYYINGLERSGNIQLSGLERVKCCRPKGTQFSVKVETVNKWATFDNPGWHACPDKKFVVGFYRNSCDELYCLEEFKCGTFA